MSKINLFEDKEYDKMEWLNKAVEPYIFPQNEILMSMPEQVSLDYDLILSLISPDQLRIEQNELIKYAAQQVNLELSANDLRFLGDFFKIVIDPHTSIDFESNGLTGAVTLVKTKPQLEESDIVEYTANSAVNLMRYMRTDSDISRLNEIMDLIGAKESRQSRSTRYKIEEITKTFKTIILEDKWRVRNMELFLKSAAWIKAFVEDGNLAAMSNFTRLKCMVHKGAPIYSLEEAK
jgi:hypothetical protein